MINTSSPLFYNCSIAHTESSVVVDDNFLIPTEYYITVKLYILFVIQ